MMFLRPSIQWRPKFDVWFWALAIWSIIVPYLFDAAHISSCDTMGKVTFVPITSIFSDDNRTFECKPVAEGEHR